MLRRFGLTALACAVLAVSLDAQSYLPGSGCEVVLQVVFPSGTAVPVGTRLIVTGEASGVPVQLITNRDGVARTRLAAGSYRIEVAANDLAADSVAASFRVYAGESSHSEYITVRKKSNVQGEATVGVSELLIPPEARKDFNKGVADLQANKLGPAAKYFTRATKAFGDYSAAWNALGVIAVRQQDIDKAEKMFRRAVAADNNAPLSLVNLGRIHLHRRQYEEGERLVAHAVQVDPRNLEALSLLGYFALLRNKMDEAIAVSQRVHTFDHKQFAMVHFIAATAYERKKLHQEAVAEYKQYLEESPDGPSAPQARAALNSLRASIR
jgi:tetratricopeptide (TPR) repeat protein